MPPVVTKGANDPPEARAATTPPRWHIPKAPLATAGPSAISPKVVVGVGNTASCSLRAKAPLASKKAPNLGKMPPLPSIGDLFAPILPIGPLGTRCIFSL